MDLVQKIGDGDGTAVEFFCTQYRQRLEFICAKRGVPWEDCRDIAQETLIAAVDHISHGRFRGESSLETWLIRILLNKATDFLRAQERQGALVPWSAPAGSRELAPEDQVPAGCSDPYLTMVIQDTLRSIPEEHRIILLLNSLEGYTTREIARIVGRSDGRVGAMLAEAKRMFRCSLRGSEEKSELRRLPEGEPPCH